MARLLPTRLKARIDEIDRRYGSVISLILGTVLLALAIVTVGLALEIKSTGDTTDAVLTDSQISRFDNTVASCRRTNTENENHNTFWLLLADTADHKPTRSEIERFTVLLRAFFPTEPECLYYGYRQVCKAKVMTTPRCRQYRRTHDVKAAERRWKTRQARLAEQVKAFQTRTGA